MARKSIALAALALALLAAGAHAARLAPAKNKKSSPDGVSFSTRASVTFGKGGSFGAGGRGGVVLQPAGCSTKCNGFTQSSGEEHTNEMYAFGLDRATLERGDAVDGTPGTPAAFMRVQLRNRGLAVPADAGMAIVNVTVRMTPVGLAGGDAPPGSEPFDVTFGVMWTPGAGSKPNAAALFSLVSPLPAVKFMAYGQPHEFSVTGLGVNELAYATGVVGTKLWWNKEDPLTYGYGAALMPEEKCKWYLEVNGQVKPL